MSAITKPQKYRVMIDRLVTMCREGQGQIAAYRLRNGCWNQNAREDFIPEQHAINQLLARLSPDEREILASMLVDQVVTGVFETLKVLEEFEISPFESAYEGSPYNDFIGRLDGEWEWPERLAD